MRKSFLTTNELDDSPRWQKITISDECKNDKDGCKYCVEFSYAKNISIADKQIAIRNIIHTLNIGRSTRLNFEVDFSYLEAVKLVGNISEIISQLGTNLYIHHSILYQITGDVEVMNLMKESSNYVLPPDVTPSIVELPEFTQEDLEDFGITSIPSTSSNTPRSSAKKIGFFDSEVNSRSNSTGSASNSKASTPEEKNNNLLEAGKLPPIPPIPSVKVK